MRIRLLIGTVVLATLAIGAFFVPAALALAAAERDAQVQELQRDASDAAARLGRAQAELDEGTLDEVEESVDQPGEDQHHFGLYDASGRLVVGDGPARADVAVDAALGGSATTARIGDERVAAVPLADGGAVRAAEPASEADTRTRNAVLRLGVAALVVLAVGTAAAWLLAQRLTRPLAALRTAATRLGGGDFTATAPKTGLAEIDEVADALNTSAGRIGALVERERQLTADASHQLRTPLAGLRVTLEAELASPRPDATEVLAEALGAVDQMALTVDALTELARDEAPVASLDVDAAVRSAGTRWRSAFASAGRALEVQAESASTAAARPAALDTVIDVLLDNALHHGRGTVVLASEPFDHVARIVVADEGACSEPDDRLFARRRSGAGGTGIGLHLARSLAEADGGRLRLTEAEPTTFQLILAPADAPR